MTGQLLYGESPDWDNMFDIGDIVICAALVTAPIPVSDIALYRVFDMSLSTPGEYTIQSMESHFCYTRQEQDLADASAVPGLLEQYGYMSNQKRHKLKEIADSYKVP